MSQVAYSDIVCEAQEIVELALKGMLRQVGIEPSGLVQVQNQKSFGHSKMIDVQKQIDYWRAGAIEDWQVAIELVNEGRYPDLLPAAPDIETARQELKPAREMFEWLNQQL